MKAHNVEIGARARAAYLHAFEGEMTQAELARKLSMGPDALTRALKGERAFASVELAELADLTGADLHELITGAPDPHAMRVLARHDYDHATGRRSVPGRDDDDAVLRDIDLVYRQAGELAPTPAVPASPEETWRVLGEGFVRPLADRVEERLGVDVVRLRELSTCYSLQIDGRLVIVVNAVGNWFRENFGIGHELGHIAARHHDVRGVPGGHEAEANAFAAALLLPRSALDAEDWSTVDDERLASLIWSYGVSTEALHRRLTTLDIRHSSTVREWADQPTQRLLRRHLRPTVANGRFGITARMTDAAARRFPLHLRNAHLRRIAAGEVGKGSLAWMLGVDAESLDVELPPIVPPLDADRLGDLLGLRSS